ncbi:MAG TPA: hypothetical protein VF552_07520 [Allosphingosinicella sp.]
MNQQAIRADTAPRSAWTAPVVRKLSAGSAEDGADNTPDGGQPS